MKTVAERASDLTNLQAKERRQHDHGWEAQTEMFRSIERSNSVIEGRVSHITSGTLALVHSDERGALPTE